MRTQIERWLLIALIAIGYLSQIPTHIHQGATGVATLVLGLLLTALFVLLLVRSSAGGALFLAGLVGVGVVFRLLAYLGIGWSVAHTARPSLRDTAIASVASILFVLVALDLWNAWRKRPNSGAPA